ncbi:uncharacterized protein BDR25DRAFT_347997 [Lindgomyces ingoldianus]|uniref:Uncharacterized protein n=1 Tax=Lindgomyces ingoldianus TaxID=673940 RepID=A0ACB6RG22_9PLEO|nr:uncharacterized protein BDR25DRAFT_347997 [Lindgomyces ingoldianus]KAF2477670.1 hypothetical protein BDR25DRAFT_347997 [Lindgomyces ingoldianus]
MVPNSKRFTSKGEGEPNQIWEAMQPPAQGVKHARERAVLGNWPLNLDNHELNRKGIQGSISTHLPSLRSLSRGTSYERSHVLKTKDLRSYMATPSKHMRDTQTKEHPNNGHYPVRIAFETNWDNIWCSGFIFGAEQLGY